MHTIVSAITIYLLGIGLFYIYKRGDCFVGRAGQGRRKPSVSSEAPLMGSPEATAVWGVLDGMQVTVES